MTARGSGGGFEAVVARSDDFVIDATGDGSSFSNPKMANFVAIEEPAPSFAEYVADSGGWLRIITGGKYLVIVTAVIESPPSTGDAQEVNIGVAKRAGIGGSDSFHYGSMNVTLWRTGFVSNMGDQKWGYPNVIEFAADDHLSLASYHAHDNAGTEVDLTVDEVRVLLIPYNQ